MAYRKLISQNRRARFEYELLDVFEAGIILMGTEVKAIREGKANISDAYGAMKNGEIYLYNAHIKPYDKASFFTHEPTRPRKLLLHKKHIRKLLGAMKEKGYTLVAMSLYINERNLVKVEVGLGKGKKLYDKRETIKKRDLDREEAKRFFKPK